MKKLLLVVLVLLIAIPVGVIFFGGHLVQAGVEKGGSAAIGTETKLGSASLSIFSGKIGLQEFSIGNPSGFSDDEAFSVKKIAVATNMQSLMTDTVEIESIEIRNPRITIEVNQKGTNLGALMDHLTGGSTSSGDTSAPGDSSSGGGKKMKIGKLRIETPKVRLIQTLLSKQEISIDLPTLEATDIGGDGDVHLRQLIEKVLAMVMAATADSNIDASLKGLLNGELASLGVDKILEDAKGQIDNVKKDLDKTLNDAKKQAEGALGGLLGGKKE